MKQTSLSTGFTGFTRIIKREQVGDNPQKDIRWYYTYTDDAGYFVPSSQADSDMIEITKKILHSKDFALLFLDTIDFQRMLQINSNTLHKRSIK